MMMMMMMMMIMMMMMTLMIWSLMSFLKFSMSYQDDGRVITKGCAMKQNTVIV